MTDIPPSVLDALSPQFMAGFLSGYLSGIDRGRELEGAEMAVLHAAAYAAIRDLADHLGTPFELRRQAMHDAQITSCEAQKREAVPWLEETSPADPGPWPPVRYLPFQPESP